MILILNYGQSSNKSIRCDSSHPDRLGEASFVLLVKSNQWCQRWIPSYKNEYMNEAGFVEYNIYKSRWM